MLRSWSKVQGPLFLFFLKTESYYIEQFETELEAEDPKPQELICFIVGHGEPSHLRLVVTSIFVFIFVNVAITFHFHCDFWVFS